MRSIALRVYHCSAEKEGVDHPLGYYIRAHKRRGFRTIGYHFLVHLDGSIDVGRPIAQIGAHARRKNLHSIGICYIGGLDKNRKPKDTRTVLQIHALRALE